MSNLNTLINGFDSISGAAFGGGGGGGGGGGNSGGYLNDACNAGLAVSNIGIVASGVTKNPYVAGATVVAFTATTGICAAAFGAGERSTMF